MNGAGSQYKQAWSLLVKSNKWTGWMEEEEHNMNKAVHLQRQESAWTSMKQGGGLHLQQMNHGFAPATTLG